MLRLTKSINDIYIYIVSILGAGVGIGTVLRFFLFWLLILGILVYIWCNFTSIKRWFYKMVFGDSSNDDDDDGDDDSLPRSKPKIPLKLRNLNASLRRLEHHLEYMSNQISIVELFGDFRNTDNLSPTRDIYMWRANLVYRQVSNIRNHISSILGIRMQLINHVISDLENRFQVSLAENRNLNPNARISADTLWSLMSTIRSLIVENARSIMCRFSLWDCQLESFFNYLLHPPEERNFNPDWIYWYTEEEFNPETIYQELVQSLEEIQIAFTEVNQTIWTDLVQADRELINFNELILSNNQSLVVNFVRVQIPNQNQLEFLLDKFLVTSRYYSDTIIQKLIPTLPYVSALLMTGLIPDYQDKIWVDNHMFLDFWQLEYNPALNNNLDSIIVPELILDNNLSSDQIILPKNSEEYQCILIKLIPIVTVLIFQLFYGDNSLGLGIEENLNNLLKLFSDYKK